MSGDATPLAKMYIEDKLSLPQIADAVDQPITRVRDRLISAGVKLRSRAEGLKLRGPHFSEIRKGKNRTFTDEWKANMKKARIKRAEETAKGWSMKATGYVVGTQGENKHRGLHVVLMEERIGRRLKEDECVHHIDSNPSNNSDNNLALVTKSGHSRLHRREEKIRKGSE